MQATPTNPKEVTVTADVDLKDEVMAVVQQYHGRYQFHIRKYYLDDNDELQPGKGLAIPLDAAIPVLQAAIEAYNEATGSQLSLQGVPDDEL